jgi:regulator of replication initiation timing
MHKDVVMTENLLAKVEEKIHILLLEAEAMRKELQHLRHENTLLRNEHTEKLKSLIALLETAT